VYGEASHTHLAEVCAKYLVHYALD
jgi:hypothetical protein